MVFDHRDEYASQYEAIVSIAAKIGCSRETLRHWVRQAERDQGLRPGPTSAEQEKIKALEREVRELRQANEILRKASISRDSWLGLHPPLARLSAFRQRTPLSLDR
jgi:transposase-like protein